MSLLKCIAAAGLLLFAAAAAHANVLIDIDKSVQTMTVSVDGVTLYRWPVSTGRKGYTTPDGSYTPFRMEEDHYSEEWDDAPMPHSIFFSPTGHAIHGSLDTRHLGSPASHGCVRLSPDNAAQLYALVTKEGLFKTKVVVHGGAFVKGRAPLLDTAETTAYANSESTILGGLDLSISRKPSPTRKSNKSDWRARAAER